MLLDESVKLFVVVYEGINAYININGDVLQAEVVNCGLCLELGISKLARSNYDLVLLV